MKTQHIFNTYSESQYHKVYLSNYEILAEVLLVCKINAPDFFGDKRNQHKVDARVLFTEFALRNGSNLNEIAQFMGKHYSTVQYYSEILKTYQTGSPGFASKYVDIEININQLKSKIFMISPLQKNIYTKDEVKKHFTNFTEDVSREFTERFANVTAKFLAISQFESIPDIEKYTEIFTAEATRAVHRQLIEKSKKNQ